MVQYFLYKFGLFLLHTLPRSWSYNFAGAAAWVHFRLSPKDRDAVIHNLKAITGRADDMRAEAFKVFLNFSHYLVDFFLMYKTVDQKFVDEKVTVSGLEHLQAAERRGKGVVLLTAHIGNWEMAGAVIDKLGYPAMVIALPHKNPKVNILFNRQREVQRASVVTPNVAVRRCMEALRKGKCVALLGDRDFGAFGEPMDFLGRKTSIPKGPAFFACRTGAPIIMSFLIPDADGRFTMSFSEPIFPSEAPDEESVVRLMKRYVPLIEAKIKEDPTQWLMFREFGIEFEHMYTHSRA
jgi:Kdo2-lipid IVA lauroyltransferase/acyltransferase